MFNTRGKLSWSAKPAPPESASGATLVKTTVPTGNNGNRRAFVTACADRNNHTCRPTMTSVKVLLFDVFGTLTDWHGSIGRTVQEVLGARGFDVDGAAFATAWRAEYQGAMEAVRSGRLPFCKLDVLHRRNLDLVLTALGLRAVDEATRQQLNFAWHQLDTWADVSPGLARLRRKYLLAPCSNGNISLMVDLARRHDWHWDAITGAELAGDYKPKAIVYRTAADAFDCAPHEVMMVAAHSSDLGAAAAAGLRTAFIARPNEHGPGIGETAATVKVDISADSLLELADALGCP